MNDQMGPGSLLDTTDSLEAVGVFRGWKNIMFLIVFLCLLILQAAFWLVNTGTIEIEPAAEAAPEAVVATPETADANAAAVSDPNRPAEAVVDLNEPAETEESKSTLESLLPSNMTFQRLSWIINFVNAILILSACLYLLSVLFGLKVSMIGKLGGINHISRAFYIATFIFVLILPWQNVFGGVVMGAIYTPCELAKAFAAERADIFARVLYYLRFSGYWLLVFFLLILSQMRTCRWTRAILRRLEVV